MDDSQLRLVPVTMKEANAFVEQHHRHHGPVRGCLCCVGVADGEGIRGVAIVGRPVSRMAQDGWTAEVTRLATDGTRNACSVLYAACWRAVRALGYRRLITYVLASESGVSLQAAGWRLVGATRAESWHRQARPRVDTSPLQRKMRYEQTIPAGGRHGTQSR